MLKEEQREAMFAKIKENEFKKLGFFTDVLMADYLSNSMLAEHKRGGKNLNTLSYDSAIGLINKVRALGINVTKVILDTVG